MCKSFHSCVDSFVSSVNSYKLFNYELMKFEFTSNNFGSKMVSSGRTNILLNTASSNTTSNPSAYNYI